MQPIMEIAPEDDVRGQTEEKPERRPVFSSNFYPITVFCWVLGVAVVGVIVALICTAYFENYTALLRHLSGG